MPADIVKAPQYEHALLEHPSSQIRLLKIITSEEFTMTTWNIEEAPDYLAISYTWGDLIFNKLISIDSQVFHVTYNAWEALGQAVPAANRRALSYVWLDSVCIQQNSNDEKSHQVGIMGTIFRHAHTVCACVGPHADGSEHLIRDRVSVTFRGAINAVVPFMRRQYWTRLWIIQELVSAIRVPCILCGYDEVNSRTLRAARAFHPDYGCIIGITDPAFRILERVAHIRNEDTSEEDRLGALLNRFWEFQCRDPRDRIFGLLGMVKWYADTSPIEPDYEVTRLQLACEVIKRVTPTTTIDTRHLADVLVALHHSVPVTLQQKRTTLLYWRYENDRGVSTILDDVEASGMLERACHMQYDEGQLYTSRFGCYQLFLDEKRSGTFKARLSDPPAFRRLSFVDHNFRYAAATIPINNSKRTIAYAVDGVASGDYLLSIGHTLDHKNWGDHAIIVRIDSNAGVLSYVSTSRVLEGPNLLSVYEIGKAGISLKLNTADVIALGATLFFAVYWSGRNAVSDASYTQDYALAPLPVFPLLHVEEYAAGANLHRLYVQPITATDSESQKQIDRVYELLHEDAESRFD